MMLIKPRADTAAASDMPKRARSRKLGAGQVIGLTILVCSLAIGAGMIFTACFVWAARDRFGIGGSLLTVLGSSLVGLSLWGRIYMKAGSIEVKLEQNREILKNLFLVIITSVGLFLSWEQFQITEPMVGASPNIPRADRPSLSGMPKPDEEYELLHARPGKTYSISHFSEGSSKLPPHAMRSLKLLADRLLDDGRLRVIIHGYADSVGSLGENQSLSLKRAEEARQLLVAAGIEPSRIEIKGHGAENPIALNAESVGRSLNRRIEVELVAREE